MSESNGKTNGAHSTPKLERWLIVISNGRTLIGDPFLTEERELGLSPVYELHGGMVPQQVRPGVVQVSWSIQIWPLLGLASLDKLAIPEGGIVIEFSSLSEMERKAIAEQVAACERNIVTMLASARTGLDLGAGLVAPR
jgi:hypothetical protein